MKCEYVGSSSNVRDMQHRSGWRETVAGFVIGASLFTGFGLLCARAMGEPVAHTEQGEFLAHSEQGDFRAVVVTADGYAWLFYTQAEMVCWLDANHDEPVVYAGTWGDSCIWYYWPGLKFRINYILTAGAEG
jgi:hypothetical protein